MNLELILYGLMALILGIISRIDESRISAKSKRERKLGYSESNYIISGWTLLFVGSVMILWGIFGNHS